MKDKLEGRYRRFINVTFLVIFLNAVMESFLLITTDRTIIILIQVALNALFYIYFLFFKKPKHPKLYGLIVFMIAYFGFLGAFSSDLVLTYNYLLKFLIPLLYYIIGFNIFLNKELLLGFVKRIWIFLAYFTFYIAIVNALKIGESLYKNGILIGYNSLNSLYLPTFAVLVILFNYTLLEKGTIKLLSLFFSITTVLIVILILKRTLILIIFLGLLLYIIKNFSFSRLMRIFFLSFVVALLVYNFSDFFVTGLNQRSSRFSEQYDVTQEGRFTENEYIWDLMKDSPVKIIFGAGEVFNDRGSIASLNVTGDRSAHNSYIRLFWNGGVIGLAVFLLFYYKQWTLIYRSYRKLKKKRMMLDQIYYFGITFVFLRFINDFSSGITYLTFNAFSYLLIGGIVRFAVYYRETPKLYPAKILS